MLISISRKFDDSALLERSLSRNRERNVPLSGNACSIGPTRNPNRLRMDHSIPRIRHSDVRPERRDDEFRVMDAKWVYRRMDQSAANALLCLRERTKKKEKIMHTSIRVCTCVSVWRIRHVRKIAMDF